MLVFKEHLEEVAWMGHSAKCVVDALREWDRNKANPTETYWQAFFKANAFVLHQAFAVSAVFIQEHAYVGGMSIARKGAKFVDYLYSAESSREAILVEIKTPTTRLLGSRYRAGVFPLSRQIGGAVAQVLSYRLDLPRQLEKRGQRVPEGLSAINPRCVVIAGNAAAELKSQEQRASFELARGAFKDVELITYDELFRKVETLAGLFSLAKGPEATASHSAVPAPSGR